MHSLPHATDLLSCFPELPNEIQSTIEELSKPFPVDEIRVRPGAVNRDGTGAMALAYHEWWTGYLPRLNDIVGPNNFRIRLLPWGSDVIAHLWAFDGLIQKWSSGKAESERIGPMDAEAQAKKRVVAEGLMLGLYLYFLPEVWMRGEYDSARKIFYPHDGEERRCAYEMYARAGLIARSQPSASIPHPPKTSPSTPAQLPIATSASERLTAARAALNAAEQRVGVQSPAQGAATLPVALASDKQLRLIITLVGQLRPASNPAINAIGARFRIADLARYSDREHLPALRAQAATLSKLDASKLIDQLKAYEAPLSQAA
jgi:hypothetical protein